MRPGGGKPSSSRLFEFIGRDREGLPSPLCLQVLFNATRRSCLCPTDTKRNQLELLRFRSEILEHSTTQIVGNLSNLSDRIPIGKVNSDRTTRNYFQPVSDQNQVVPTGSNWKDSQKSNINRSPDIRINQRH